MIQSCCIIGPLAVRLSIYHSPRAFTTSQDYIFSQTDLWIAAYAKGMDGMDPLSLTVHLDSANDEVFRRISSTFIKHTSSDGELLDEETPFLSKRSDATPSGR